MKYLCCCPFRIGSVSHEDTFLTIANTPKSPMENPISYTPTSPEFIRDHTFFVQSTSITAGGTSMSLQSRVTSLEAEVSDLRDQLGRAKGVNDVMWETVVQKMIPLANMKDKMSATPAVDDEVESERGRKRGRL